MIRFVLRLIGLLCLALGFIFLVYDGTRSIADNSWHITDVRFVWTQVHDSSISQLQPAVERVAPWLWDPILVRFLSAPSALVLSLFGAILLVVGRKKRPLIGYGRD
ncbi:MAG: hypothetical protein QOF91_2989 [Alphaproteobacteria bacterium]|jgi:hypothetical protein|nr:hypothetical protein [Alphaproteobacteria bacterium]